MRSFMGRVIRCDRHLAVDDPKYFNLPREEYAMKIRRVLLLVALMVFLVGFSGSNQATATGVSPECLADLRAVVEQCKEECPRNLRCFIRCVVANFPDSCR